LQSRGAPTKIDLSVRLFACKNQTTPERCFSFFDNFREKLLGHFNFGCNGGEGGNINDTLHEEYAFMARLFGLHSDTHQAKQKTKIKINLLLPSYCIEPSFAVKIRI
jgi:hypothetical protein